MPALPKRKSSLTLDADALDVARELGVNVSEARRQRWREDNAEAFAAQADWHERNGHPLAEILATPKAGSWT